MEVGSLTFQIAPQKHSRSKMHFLGINNSPLHQFVHFCDKKNHFHVWSLKKSSLCYAVITTLVRFQPQSTSTLFDLISCNKETNATMFVVCWMECIHIRDGHADIFGDAQPHRCGFPHYPTYIGYSAIYAAHISDRHDIRIRMAIPSLDPNHTQKNGQCPNVLRVRQRL